jgi:hypothetical protein
MNAQRTSDLIQLLDRVAARPSAFFGEPNVLVATTFLCGFRTALSLAHDLDWDIGDSVMAERGWKPGNVAGPGPYQQMLRAGMSPAQVIAELVAIEIETLKRSVAEPAVR